MVPTARITRLTTRSRVVDEGVVAADAERGCSPTEHVNGRPGIRVAPAVCFIPESGRRSVCPTSHHTRSQKGGWGNYEDLTEPGIGGSFYTGRV